ncbi:MAG: radical SAM protein [Polyangiaceae bacterium]
MASPIAPNSPSWAVAHPLGRVTRVPRKCLWEVTRQCNLDCVHCDNHARTPSKRELGLDELKRIAEELWALGGKHVDVTGGEPLSMPGWDEFCRHLTTLGFEVALITNGTLLEEDALERLVAAGVRHIGISVDGCQATHDATRRFVDDAASPFEKTMCAIRKATRRLSVTVITQVNRTNLDELTVLGRSLGQLGVDRWQLQLAVPTPRVLARTEPYVLAPSDLPELTNFILRAASDRIDPLHPHQRQHRIRHEGRSGPSSQNLGTRDLARVRRRAPLPRHQIRWHRARMLTSAS